MPSNTQCKRIAASTRSYCRSHLHVQTARRDSIIGLINAQLLISFNTPLFIWFNKQFVMRINEYCFRPKILSVIRLSKRKAILCDRFCFLPWQVLSWSSLSLCGRLDGYSSCNQGQPLAPTVTVIDMYHNVRLVFCSSRNVLLRECSSW